MSALLYILGTAFFGLVAGVATVPTIASFPPIRDALPKSVRGAMGRILWSVGAVTLGRYVLDKTADGSYTCRSVYKTGDGDWAFDRNGEQVVLEGPETRWSRLGLTPFGVTYEKSEQQFEGVRTHHGEEVVEHGGEVGFSTATGEGWPISIPRIMSRLKGSAGIAALNAGQDKAFEEHGGGAGQSTSQKMLMVAMVFALVCGALTAWLVMAA